MGLALTNVWTGQTASGYIQSMILSDQSSLRPKFPVIAAMTIAAKYAWYWSPGWQAWEKEADEDWEAGRYEVFESMDDFIKSLDTG